MAQAISLSYIAPLLALLLGALFLGERVGGRVVGASLAALGGVAIIVAGQREASSGPEAFEGAIAILASAVLYAANLVVARVQSQAARPAEIAFFQSGFVTLILLLGAPWFLAVPDAAQHWKIAVGALLASASLFLLAWAYAHGETGYLATTEYTSFVYAAVLGWAVFGEHVALTTLLGAAVIVAACLYAARRRDMAQAAVQAAS
jgi:S-adenosylmethionine uptake transporter